MTHASARRLGTMQLCMPRRLQCVMANIDIIACAFVPWKAKALTDAHFETGIPQETCDWTCLGTVMKLLPRINTAATLWFTVRKCETECVYAHCNDADAANILAMPEAGSLWPIIVFVAPVTSEHVKACDDDKAGSAALISMGSPSIVPVPCNCKTVTGSELPETRIVSQITSL